MLIRLDHFLSFYFYILTILFFVLLIYFLIYLFLKPITNIDIIDITSKYITLIEIVKIHS